MHVQKNAHVVITFMVNDDERTQEHQRFPTVSKIKKKS